MEQGRRYGFGLAMSFFFISSSIALVSMLPSSVDAYQNYTVGGSMGWYDSQVKPDVDYQNWAAGKNFSLGDFLIFNTDTNHSVIQTYNITTYKLCDYADSLDKDTVEWSAADPSNTATQAVTVAVPLVREGANYFFSGDYDGDQCRNGQHFEIEVLHGQGLPKSIDESPGPVSPDSGDQNSAPDTGVPANFNNPQDQSGGADNGTDSSGSASSSACVGKLLNGAVFLLFSGTAVQMLMI